MIKFNLYKTTLIFILLFISPQLKGQTIFENLLKLKKENHLNEAYEFHWLGENKKFSDYIGAIVFPTKSEKYEIKDTIESNGILDSTIIIKKKKKWHPIYKYQKSCVNAIAVYRFGITEIEEKIYQATKIEKIDTLNNLYSRYFEIEEIPEPYWIEIKKITEQNFNSMEKWSCNKMPLYKDINQKIYVPVPSTNNLSEIRKESYCTYSSFLLFKEIEEKMVEKGYLMEIDGKLTFEKKMILVKFQKDNGFEVGVIGEEMRNSLNITRFGYWEKPK